MNPVDDEKNEARILGMMGIRDSVRTLIDLQLNGAPDDEILDEQRRLNVLYDSFTKKYGLINSKANKLAFKADSSYPLLYSLEVLDEDGGFDRKADMFTQRTIQCPHKITHTDTASEAFTVSLGTKACVDIKYMARLLGDEENTDRVISELKGIIFKDPDSGSYEENPYNGWQTSDEYLSGNIRTKLASAQAAAEKNSFFAVNAEYLEKVLPPI